MRKRIIAITSSLIFITHPIHTESVAFISGRTDLLVLFFSLISFYFYVRSQQSESWPKFLQNYIMSIISFVLAVFSKETAIILPVVFFMYDFCFSRKFLKSFKFYIPFIGFISAFLFARVFLVGIEIVTVKSTENLYSTALTTTKILAEYIKLLFVPVNLSPHHPVSFTSSFLDPGILASIALISTILLAIVKMYKGNKIMFFWACWFFITLFPSLNVLPQLFPMAEHYLYVPSVGFCVLIPLAMYYLTERFPNRILPIFLIGYFISIIVFYSAITVARNADWKDNMTLWTNTVNAYPESDIAHLNLGNAYFEEKMYFKAEEEFKLVLEKDPNSAIAHNNLGNTYAEKDMYDEAINEYKKSLAISPNRFKVYINLGGAYLKKGMQDNAIVEFKNALNIEPNLIDPHKRLGDIYLKKGMYDEAINEYKNIIGINPGLAEVHYNMGIAYGMKGLYTEAVAEYQQALALSPDYAEAHNNLGNMYIKIRLIDDAIRELEKAVRINPDLTDVHNNLGIAYFAKSLYNKSIEEFKNALVLDPQFIDARYNLGIVYLEIGQYSLAKQEFENILEIDPNNERAMEGLKEAEIAMS